MEKTLKNLLDEQRGARLGSPKNVLKKNYDIYNIEQRVWPLTPAQRLWKWQYIRSLVSRLRAHASYPQACIEFRDDIKYAYNLFLNTLGTERQHMYSGHCVACDQFRNEEEKWADYIEDMALVALERTMEYLGEPLDLTQHAGWRHNMPTPAEQRGEDLPFGLTASRLPPPLPEAEQAAAASSPDVDVDAYHLNGHEKQDEGETAQLTRGQKAALTRAENARKREEQGGAESE